MFTTGVAQGEVVDCGTVNLRPIFGSYMHALPPPAAVKNDIMHSSYVVKLAESKHSFCSAWCVCGWEVGG